jgi:two-component system, cell cycle response regulator DivK
MSQADFSQSPRTATGPSVLVVDDNPDNRELLAEYLTFVGCTVATASTGAEAIVQAEAMRPQVVLMDLGLPGMMDGWEATRTVKAHPLLKRAVVIAVTAHGFPADVERAMHAGCHAVVIKPYDLTALAEQVQRVVSQRQHIES